MKATAICDGRGNAGTGARAVVLVIDSPDGKYEAIERAERLGPKTNIVAEHLAIQLAMEVALEHGVTDLLIWNDSRSPVNHVNRTYRVIKPHLKPIVEETWEMSRKFKACEIEWHPREDTKRADALCRKVDRPAARGRPGA
jgi:ribonuclease HI